MPDITANVVVSQPAQLFTLARSFKANANGKIYIGLIDEDPVNPANQIQVYLENEDGTHVPVAQPLIINAGGYPVYNGQIAKFVTVEGHSMATYNAYGVQEFYYPNVLKYDPDQFEKKLASPADGLGDALVTVKQPLVGAIARSQHDKNSEAISITDFGAIGDGTSHPLSEQFSTLLVAQMVYPFVTSLTQTIDWAAIQSAVNIASTNGAGLVYVPSAKNNKSYVIGQSVIVPTYVSIYGDGIWSRIEAAPGLTGDAIKLDTGPSRGPMFLRDFGIMGNGTCNGLGTTITQNITAYKYIYGYTFQGLTVDNCDTAYLMQGLWHSAFINCTSGSSRIGLHFLRQCVSNLVEGCHFRLDTRAKANSVGLLIEPKRYDFQPSGDTSQSESIVIDGATMCIGYDVGMWVVRGLDIQISNVCLDYCWSQGLKVDNTIGCFSFNDSWIAGGTGQFIGINLGAQPVGNKRVIRSVQLAATNRAGSIGVQAINAGLVDLTNSQVLGGTYSLYASNSNSMNVRDNILGGQMYFHNNTNCNVDGNRIDGGIDYQNTSKHLGNVWGVNQGASTRGRLLISMPANATTGTVSIPNPIANAKYAVLQQHLDPIDKSDVISLAGNTITLTRAAPSSAFQIDAVVEYSIVY